jgi:hypothetical protein
MRWRKLGLVRGASGTSPWAAHSALQPTPLIRGNEIRVYVGFRDHAGRSSVAYIDVDAEDPTRTIRVSAEPVLMPGSGSAFDCDGAVPCAVASDGDRLRLYYAGYQQATDVRFRAFGGLAISDDRGDSFWRISEEPVVGPTHDENLFRVVHSIRWESGRWRVWYGAGKTFLIGRKGTLPVYDIRYTESPDGIAFPTRGKVVIPLARAEHRVGRPYVVKGGPGYQMFYGIGTETHTFRLGYAESIDGITWQRLDTRIGIDVSPSGFDSSMIAYPAVVDVASGRYLFYNGDDYGRAGFGVAKLEAD